MQMNYRIWEANAGRAAGFSAYLIRLLQQIHILEEYENVYSNNLPIWIDWVRWPVESSYICNYHEGDKMPFVNSWDYYFINPINTDWALQSMKENPHSWISTEGQYYNYPPGQGRMFFEKNILHTCNKYIEKYFKPKQDILDSLNKDISKYNTLGVHCRRSDMASMHPNIGLNFLDEDYFYNTMKIFKEGGFEKIYLATEETAIYKYFMERIPELILCQHDCFRVDQQDSPVYQLQMNPRPLHRYLMGKEILIDILNLSKCNSLMCSISGVSNMATMFNGDKYSNVWYFDWVKDNLK